MEKNFNYAYNWEYAVKRSRPVSENRDSVEVYDTQAKKEVDTSKWDLDVLVDLIWEVLWNWNKITEKEFQDMKKGE